MPYISELTVQNLRNLGSVKIAPSMHINLITGPNGAGKTSLLESISYLSNGRSFRTNKYKNIIREGSDDLLLRGKIVQEDGEEETLAILRDRSGQFTIKRGQDVVSSASELARGLPLIVLDSHSFDVFEGSPKDRRKLFDWLVFHVKHSFQGQWGSVLKCYKQRNSLLRSDKIGYSDLEPWDLEIAKLANQMANSRLMVFDVLEKKFSLYAGDMIPSIKSLLSCRFQQGWRENETSEPKILEQLKQAFPRDRSLGYSTLGPHKADLIIRVDNKPPHEILSRGQQKLIITALYLAMLDVLSEMRATKAVFLIDDLSAEFDRHSLERVLTRVKEQDNQCFITSIESVLGSWSESLDQERLRMFHVEHGECAEN